MKFLLIHQYAGNKGDRAVAAATVRLLLNLYPDCEITISTSDPHLWAQDIFMKECVVKFVPSAWDFENIPKGSKWWKLARRFKPYTFTILRETSLLGIAKPFLRGLANPAFLRALEESDAVISVGGHHFTTLLSTDLVSGINYDAMCVAAAGKRLGCFSQSFGPFKFHNGRNERITRKLLNNSILYSREKSSRKQLVELGIENEKIYDTCESVISLVDTIEDYKLPSLRSKKVGIAIYATQWDSEQRRQRYIDDFAEVCRRLIAKGYDVEFFPMELKNTEPDDRRMILSIKEKIGDNPHLTIIDRDMPSIEHIQRVGECQVFIGHKTHSTIFALTSGTPLIGIAYHPKTREFMKQYGNERYCIDDQNFTAEAIINSFDSIQQELDKVGTQQYESSRQMSERITSDLRSLVSSL